MGCGFEDAHGSFYAVFFCPKVMVRLREEVIGSRSPQIGTAENKHTDIWIAVQGAS